MKQRTTLLLLACALLIAPLSGFAAPLASMATAACAATSSTAPPPFFAPASSTSVTKAALIGPVCGSCSPSPCAGAKVGSICGIGGGGQYKFCADVGNCSDTLTQCLCKTGPPF